MSSDFHFTQLKPKSELSAHLLNILCPGAGLMYWRRSSLGAIWLIIFLFSSLGLLMWWMIHPFLPQLLGVLILTEWLILEWYLFDQVRLTSADDSSWSRGVNSLGVIFGLALICTSLLFTISYIVFTRVYTFIEVTDHSMFPQLITGDKLLVSKRLPEDGLNSGQVIAYKSTINQIRVARVLANHQDADQVKINQLDIYFDGEALKRSDPVSIEVEHFQDSDRQQLRSSIFSFEYSKKKSAEQRWLISQPLNRINQNKTLIGRLGTNTLLVASDVRYPSTDELNNPIEIINQAQIIGIPLMIISSKYQHEKSSSRRGLKIH